MIQDREIRKQIAALLGRQLSLSAFEQWLGSESWGMFNDSPDAVPLVLAVNMLVSELHDQTISPEAFRSELQDLLNNIVISQAIEVTREQQSYFEYVKMANLLSSAQAAGLVAA